MKTGRQSMDTMMYGDELWMTRVDYEADGTPVISVDMHNYSCAEARNIIRKILATYKFEFKLNVIHGCNHGNAIQTLLRTNFKDGRVYGMQCGKNKGLTTLLVS